MVSTLTSAKSACENEVLNSRIIEDIKLTNLFLSLTLQ